MVEKLPTGTIFHSKCDVIAGFKGEIQWSDILTIHAAHYVTLILYYALLAILYDEMLIDQL
jgi:hypothetical protein